MSEHTHPKTGTGVTPPQTSVFDGNGNESVVVLANDEEGFPREGTGPDAESARADVDSKEPIGEGFSPEG